MSLSRRELLIGGTAGTAALAAIGCSPGFVNFSLPKLNAFELPVQYATLPIGGVTIRTRTYGGTIPGPTMVTAPGQAFTVNVTNKLPPNPAASPAPGIDPLDNPHAFNSTNLHVHGLQVVPHIFDPIGTTNPNASIIAIAPGTSLQYPFVLPSDHPSGLFWYHPHAHGSTDTQVSGGMAGLVIVKGPIDQVPEIAAARDIPIAVQTLNLNLDPSTGMYTDEYIAYQPASSPAGPTGGYTPRSSNIFVLVNGQLVSRGSNFAQGQVGTSAPVWSASSPPQIQIAPGEVVRLRILNGSNSLLLPLQLQGCAVYVIAVDGVNLLAPYLVPASGNLPSAPGNRIELLVQAPPTPGTYTLAALATGSLPGTDVSTHAWPGFNLMQFVVSGQPVTMGIPASLPTPSREYPLIANGDATGQRTVALNSGNGPTILSGTSLTVNNLLYNEANILFNLALGTTDTWTVTNLMTNEGHPFHIHTNSMQVVSVTGANPLIPLPYVADTVWIPPGGQVVFKMRYKQWRGKTVFHCHKLPHEDQGMMANVMFV